jgi:hypothetical protein
VKTNANGRAKRRLQDVEDVREEQRHNKNDIKKEKHEFAIYTY